MSGVRECASCRGTGCFHVNLSGDVKARNERENYGQAKNSSEVASKVTSVIASNISFGISKTSCNVSVLCAHVACPPVAKVASLYVFNTWLHYARRCYGHCLTSVLHPTA
jgi:hypothetical protein